MIKLRRYKAIIFIMATALMCIGLPISKVKAQQTKPPKSLSNALKLKGIPKIASDSGIIMDEDSGAILFAKKINKKHYPASITKVMTVLLALENGDVNDDVVCSKTAVTSIEPGSSHIGIKPDEVLHFKDALHAILLKSANEVSNGIAEYVAGDLKSFAKMMTKRAKELGCKHTHFVNANGLHDDKHYTTAYDMALILREDMKHDLFRQIIMTRQSYVPKTNLTDEKRYLANSNQLILKNSKFYYDKCTGGKTGFTRAALHTLVNSAQDEDMRLLSVVMRSQARADKWNDTVSMFEFCFDNFYNLKLNSDKGDRDFKSLKAIKENGKPIISDDSTLRYVNSRASVTLPKDADLEDTVLSVQADEIKNNERLIHLTYFYDDFPVGYCDVIEKIKEKPIANSDMEAASDNEGASNRAHSGINFNIILFVVLGIIAVVGIIFAVVFFKRKSREEYIFRKKKKNKFNFDKSLFKRH